ncbi:MAG: glycosyltransferase family 4 protein [Tannerella sp.]|nr:glycosyltransferase family 4 protein [Tannerella sp.]
MKVAVAGLRGFPDIQGGIETHCEELYPRLVELGCDVTVLRRKPFVRETPPRTSWKGVKFHDLATSRKTGAEALVHTFKSVWYAFRMKAEILHIHAIGPSVAVPFAKLLGLKVVVTHHGPDYNRLKWGWFARLILRTGECLAARQADEIIVISTVIRDLLREKYNRTRGVHLIYNGVNLPEQTESTAYIRSLGLAPGKYILSVGRFVEEKNFDRLIRACAALPLPEDCRLVIAGAADHPTAYSAALEKLAAGNRTVLTGMIKGSPLQELYTHARVFVLPSSHEGMPLVLLEAMSYGLPILASDIPANKAMNLPPEMYFPTGDEHELAHRLRQMMCDKTPKRIHYRIPDSCNWTHIARQTVEVYGSLCK